MTFAIETMLQKVLTPLDEDVAELDVLLKLHLAVLSNFECLLCGTIIMSFMREHTRSKEEQHSIPTTNGLMLFTWCSAIQQSS